MYEVTDKFAKFDGFVRLCGEARTQADLDELERITAQLVRDGRPGVGIGGGVQLGAAVYKAVPLARVAAAARQVDELFRGGVAGILRTRSAIRSWRARC